MKDPKRYRRRFFYGGLLVVLVALAVPVTQAIARVTSPIEKNSSPYYCGQSIGQSTVGSVSLDRSGDTLSVAIHSRGAFSSHNAYAYLYSPEYSCDPYYYIAYLGNYKTTNGSGDKTASVDVSGYGPDFFVCIYYDDTERSDCSLAARP
jgi:hypothetical protein